VLASVSSISAAAGNDWNAGLWLNPGIAALLIPDVGVPSSNLFAPGLPLRRFDGNVRWVFQEGPGVFSFRTHPVAI
jgi:hypothetical protein